MNENQVTNEQPCGGIGAVASSVVEVPESIQLFDVFEDYDRFAFPAPVYRVTGGHGGEAILVCGPEKTALLDCGMAYCAEVTLGNLIRRLSALGRDRLDYILLSHSHYDHIGALPWIREAFPGAVVAGSQHCADILVRPGARSLMKELGEDALQLYEPGSTKEIRVDGLEVDRVLREGDVIDLGASTGTVTDAAATTAGTPSAAWAAGAASVPGASAATTADAEELGARRIRVLETQGHTDCSLSFFLEPMGMLFTSESTGIIEGKMGGTPDGRGYIHTPILKDFAQAMDAGRRCQALHPAYLCLPHFGLVPPRMLERYWDDFFTECENKVRFIRTLRDGGLDQETMLQRYADRYWTTFKAMEQPKEAFMINSKNIIKAVLKELERREQADMTPIE